MYENVEYCTPEVFPLIQIKNTTLYLLRRLARINNQSFHHDAVKEETILKSVKDLVSGKHKIMDLDY